MAIDANTGDFITVNEAQDFVREFRRLYPAEIKGGFIGYNTLYQLVKDGAMGIRIYNGYDAVKEQMNFVIVGVDDNGADMTNLIVERLAPCPADCDSSSPLN